MSGNELEWALRNRIAELERILLRMCETGHPLDREGRALIDNARAVLEKGKQPSAAGSGGARDVAEADVCVCEECGASFRTLYESRCLSCRSVEQSPQHRAK